ncbi:Uncharacterised protein [Mycobacteroides abscessus subsp. abscessus]|nr:Uncharacterised protein [Mycobacteroides abscessus subsp. abscessus]
MAFGLCIKPFESLRGIRVSGIAIAPDHTLTQSPEFLNPFSGKDLRRSGIGHADVVAR